MKRVVAVSDSHGAVDHLRDAISLAAETGRIDILVFLGDCHSDIEALRPELSESFPNMTIYAVRGNNDWRHLAPSHVVFKVNGITFYACHGHEWQVKYSLHRLCYAAKEKEAQIALYGHTHISRIDNDYGLRLINPGAICERNAGKAAYAEIRVEDDGLIRTNLVLWK